MKCKRQNHKSCKTHFRETSTLKNVKIASASFRDCSPVQVFDSYVQILHSEYDNIKNRNSCVCNLKQHSWTLACLQHFELAFIQIYSVRIEQHHDHDHDHQQGQHQRHLPTQMPGVFGLLPAVLRWPHRRSTVSSFEMSTHKFTKQKKTENRILR